MPKHKEDPEELRPIGERIAQARAAAGLTQGELGDLAGLDTQTISKLERGLQAVGSMPMRRMAMGLKVSMDWLCGLDQINAPVPAYASLDAFVARMAITDEGELSYLRQQRFMGGEPDENTWMACLATFRATRRNKSAPDRSEELGKDSPDVMPLKAPRKPNRGAR